MTDMPSRRRWPPWTRNLVQLVLLLVVVGITLSSYFYGAQLAYSDDVRIVGVTTDAGNFWFYFGIRWMANKDGYGIVFRTGPRPIRPVDRFFLPGCGTGVYGTDYLPIPINAWPWIVFWLVVLNRKSIKSHLDSHQGDQYHLTRGERAGRCDKCGYDLRATPFRCPECGTVPRW